ncbi:hypothetical protein BS47DRAFT_1254742, partial [Hydnum rufescens UP504]
CECQPLALALMNAGMFPSSPIQPHFAFDLNHLLWASALFLYGAPNISAWSGALTAYLTQKGFDVPSEARLSGAVSSGVPALDWTTERVESLSQKQRATSYFPSTQDHCPVNDDALSPYLQSQCFLCHPTNEAKASKNLFHGIYCLDACFQQVRLRGASGSDPELNISWMCFLSPEDIAKAKLHVERHRKGKGSVLSNMDSLEAKDIVEPGLKIPISVLNNCEKSFKATDENRQKGSAASFADTGLMALICMHDRVLYLANVTSPGEKQYYAVALLMALFRGLPSWWKAGILYDIGCQLHRSTLKFRLMPKFSNRIEWGISVFHAFGHQWPCQCIYHPLKREGFGFSDGEGCERCWGALKKLIPILHVSGHNRRLFYLDLQVSHMSNTGLGSLGHWLYRRITRTVGRLQDAKHSLAQIGIPIEDLRDSWKEQVAAQSKPLPIASKNLASAFVTNLLSMIEAQSTTQASIQKLLKDMAALPDNSESAEQRVDMTIQQSDLEASNQRLSARIAKAVKQLTEKDSASAAVLEKAKGDKFPALKLRIRALKHRIRARIRERRFESERLERAYFRATLDHKAHAQTADALKRRAPAIKRLVSQYNTLCGDLKKLQSRSPSHRDKTIPKPLEVSSIFGLGDADEVWEDAGLDLDEEEHPPAWLADEPTRNGIKAMHIHDRAIEDISYLKDQLQSLVAWLKGEWRAI